MAVCITILAFFTFLGFATEAGLVELHPLPETAIGSPCGAAFSPAPPAESCSS